MSQTIDSRVVEMKFDNKNFEKNVAESMKTLESLSKRLDNLENTQVNLDKIGKAADSLDLSKIDKALDSITHRFSVMGQIGASVLNNLATDAYNLAKGLTSKVWNTVFGQMKTGGQARAGNVENAKFLLEGMGIAFDDSVDKAISDAVADTAFGYDEAAMAMAQLSGASVQLGDDMNQALAAISGVAAMTNRSFSDIADIFVDSAAAGKVAGDAFNRLGERGLAAKGIMQEFYGVTAEELDKLAKKGAISFNDFSKAMYDAFGSQAKKSNETLNGVLANTRAVLSRMGQSFYQPLMANNSDVVKMFQSLKDVMKGFEAYVKPLGKEMAEYVLKLSRYAKGILDGIDVSKYEVVFTNLSKVFKNLTMAGENLYSNVLKPFAAQFKMALYEVFPSLNTGKSLIVTISDKLVELSDRFRKFTSEIGLFGDKGVALREVLKTILSSLKAIASACSALATAIKPLLKLVGTLGKVLVTNVGRVLSGILTNLPGIVNIGANIVAGIITGILSGASIIGNAVVAIGRIIIDLFCSFFGIHSPSTLMMLMVGVPIVAGVAAGIILGKDKVKEAIDVIGEVIKTGMEKIVDLVFYPFELIGNKLKAPFKKITTFIKNTAAFRVLRGVFELLANSLQLFNVIISRTIASVMALDSAGFSKMLNNLKSFIVTIVTMVSLNKLSKAINAFGIGIGGIGKAIKTGLIELSKSVRAYARARVISSLADIFKNLAIAVAVITGAILLMSYAVGDPQRWEKIKVGIEIIGGIVGTLVAIVTAYGIASSKLEGFSGKNLSGLALAFVGIGGAIFLVASAVKKVGVLDWTQLAAAFVGIVGLVMAVGWAIQAFEKHSNGFTSKDNYKLITSFGVTVWLLASAVRKISLIAIFSPEALKKATISILSIVGVFGLIAIAMEGLSKLKYGETGNMGMIKEMPLTFLAIGVAVNAIASAIKKLSKIEEADLDRAFDKIETIMLLIAAIVGFAHFAQAAVSHIMYSIAAVVAACGLVIGVLGSIENEDVIERGFNILKKLAAGILVFVGILQMINRYVGGGDSDLKTLLYISAIIVAVTGMIGVLSLLDPAKVWSSLGVLTVFGVELLAFIYVLEKIQKKSTQLTRADFFDLHKQGKKGIVDKIIQFGEIIKMIDTIVSAISKLSITLAIVSKVVTDWQQVGRAIAIMGSVMIPVIATLLLLDNIDTGGGENIKDLAKTLRAITGMILVISGSLLVLSQMPLEQMAVAGAEIMVLLSVVGMIIDVSKETEGKKINTKGLAAAAAAIAMIGASLWALTFFNQGEGGIERITAACLGLATCLVALGGMFKMAEKFKMGLKTGGAIAIAALSFVEVAAAIALLASFGVDWQTAVFDILALGGCILAIGAALKLAQNVRWAAVVGLLAGATAMVGVAFALWLIADYKWYELLPSFMALAGIVTILAGILAALTILADTGIGAVGIVIVAAAIAILSASLIGMSIAMGIAVQALTQFVSLFTPETASNILGFFTTLGDGMGDAAKSIMNGVKEAVNAFREGVAALKQESSSAGADFVGGFVAGILSSSPLVRVAAVALGALAIFGLRSKEGIDSHSNSKKTIEAGKDFDGGLGEGIASNASLAINPAKSLGTSIVESLKGNLLNGVKNTNWSDIWGGIKNSFSDFKPTDAAKALTNPASLINKIWGGIGSAFGENAIEGVKEGVQSAVGGESDGGIMDSIKELFSGGLSAGNFDNVLGGFDWTSILGGDGVSVLKDYLSEAGVKMDNLSGDNIPKLVDQLKNAGYAGDDLINALKELGITEEQLKDLGLADKLGLDTAKEGAEELKTTIQDLADEIINGKFGNAPERWDRMFEALIKSGKTAEEAYAAIADAQNEVNKRLGSSVVHNAEEMEKKVSESAKKAAGVTSKTTGKPAKDFTKELHKAVTDITKDDAKSSAEEQMKNNMPYANYLAAKEHQITGEREKQTAEVYKQKLANEHMYTLKEKEQAMAGLKANQELATNSTLSAEKQKQLDAENRKYQAVVDTYNKQQEMLKVIQDQEAATKKAEDAEKKRGEAAAKSTSGVQYGSAEYEKQKKGTTINNRKTIVKQETKPVQAETKVEVTPKFEVKNVDVTNLKTSIINKVETEVKELNTKVDITPKINTSQAETQIANFKQKTNELKTSIPETFNGIAQKVSEHFTKISSMVITGGGKLTANTRSVFQNAVAAATGVLTSSETISKFYNAGKQAATGYVNGIKSQAGSVKTASANLGNNSAKTVKSVLGVKSPSRVFMQIGEYAGEGYVIGLQSYMGAVESVSSDLSQASIDGVYRVVNAVQNAVNEGLDVTPTITPVFDSINVQNGLGDVSSMMDLSQRDIASISANIDAKASYDNSQVEEMQNRMTAMQSAFNDLATILNNQPTPVVEANVNLLGEAQGIFRAVQSENARYTKMHGKSALA